MDHTLILTQSVGGLGLFLLGMLVMTQGLQEIAGDAMRTALMRFTKSPTSGALTGATTTAILQSSSATTVAAIGFVGVGLMSFPEALGIIFGANIGTTITGWIVALLGFKLHFGTIMLPLILVGAILRLFSKGRIAASGFAVAGFGLIFVGIAMMQQGMSGLEGWITPERFPDDSLAGRLKLVALGIMTTVITQSSSAGVAATLTALHAGAINFPQAACLVIGMDIGTTVTAIIATIGGSVGAKRTGYSHVIFNFYSATCALILLTPYTLIWEGFAPGELVNNAEIALVAFHTSYNIICVALLLPFTTKFSRAVETLVPIKTPQYTDKLDRPLLAQPSLALSAVQATIPTEFLALLAHINALLGDKTHGGYANLRELQLALDETRRYMDEIHLSAGDGEDFKRLVAIIHTLDHLQRLHERCDEEQNRAITARNTVELAKETTLLVETIVDIIDDINNNRWIEAHQRAAESEKIIHQQVRPYREAIMTNIADGKINAQQGTAHLEAIRWLRRVSKHITRISQHYSETIIASSR